MIGTTVSQHRILEKLGEGGMSENCLRVLFTSSCNFQPARLFESSEAGGDPPSFAFFASACFLAEWQTRGL